MLPLGVDEPGRIDVDALLSLSEETLERQCTFSAFRTRGPGGQKRNKTASAAKLVHGPTGIVSQCNEFRSQAANRRRALHRLRFKIAAGHRTALDPRGYEPPEWLLAMKQQGKLTTNTKNPDYARIAAHALDVLEAAGARLAAAAALLEISTHNLVRVLSAEPSIQSAAHQIRQKHGVTWERP